jgi:predicted metal-dependent hydrolase
MNTKKQRMQVCNLKVETIRKDIKNIHLGVYPPNGRVRVAAPLKTSDESIRLMVITKIPWIKKQKSKFSKQERQTKRDYVSGESHYFFGKRYLLNVQSTDSKPRVEIKRNKFIDLHINQDTALEKREKVLEEFYRSEIKKHIPALVDKWEKIIGVNVKEAKVKKMKTKWGTCNPKDKRIWLNLELAKKPLNCMEYVIVHEMIHFLEKSHNDKYRYLISSHLPQWEQYRNELNNSVLGYSSWR